MAVQEGKREGKKSSVYAGSLQALGLQLTQISAELKKLASLPEDFRKMVTDSKIYSQELKAEILNLKSELLQQREDWDQLNKGGGVLDDQSGIPEMNHEISQVQFQQKEEEDEEEEEEEAELGDKGKIWRMSGIPEWQDDSDGLVTKEANLAEFLGEKEEALVGEIRRAYQENLQYARKNKVARGVLISLLKKRIRDITLKKEARKPWKMEDLRAMLLEEATQNSWKKRKDRFWMTENWKKKKWKYEE